MAAIQAANSDVGAMVMELSEREYMVRGLGYLEASGTSRTWWSARRRPGRRSAWRSWGV
jgi:hypothetical protein